METRFIRFFLMLFLTAALSGLFPGMAIRVMADDSAPAIIDPDEDRIIVQESDIRAFDIEFGLATGMMSVQDFGTNSLVDLSLDYHVTRDFFLDSHYGFTTLGKTSFEKLQPGFTLLSNIDRDYSYFTIGLGYNLFQGESFFGENHAFNSAFYTVLATGYTNFAGDKSSTFAWGFGYRVVFLDWLAVHLDARDHLFNSDIFTRNERFHSLALQAGISFFF